MPYSIHNRSLLCRSAAALGLLCVATAVAVEDAGSQGAVTQPAQGKAAAPAFDTIFAQDTSIITNTLPNGLRYYIRRNAKPENRVEMRLVVKAGSLMEDDDQRGLAHFVEHMAFNGTKHFRKNELITYLESIGMRFGADLNAYTSFDHTVYSLQVPTDNHSKVSNAMQILEDWAHGVTFDPAAIDAERGVIVSEWRSRLGAGSRVLNKHIGVMYKGSRYPERMPIGTVETIQSASPDALRRFYRDWYRPDLMSVIVVGDIDPAAMETMIRAHFGKIAKPASPRPAPVFPIPAHGKPLVSIVSDPELNSASVTYTVRVPSIKAQTAAGYRAAIVQRIYDQMVARRFRDIATRPNAPFLSAGAGRESPGGGVSLYKIVANIRGDNLLPGFEAALAEVERIAQHGFLPEELEREKQQLSRSLQMMVTEHKNVRSAQVASSYVEAILGNTVITAFAQDIERLRQVAPTITLDEVNREALAWRSKENRIILVDMPEKAGFQRPTEAALLATVDAAAQRTMAAYTEQTVDAQLLPALPTPGAVVSEKKYPSVGITEWRLSNGLRVLLKPTDFRADQIGVVGTSLGGYQSLPDSDYMTGRLMELVIGQGGYGQFSASELRKLLSGKIVSVRQQVDAGSESISGSSSNADLETLFQLFHLAITSPRYDSVAIASSIDNARISLENRNANSMVPFGDSINAIMTQSHPKLTPITVQSLDSINPRRAIEILKERFSNIDDFTFMIVGSFVPDSIKPYVTRYLGSLPATGRFESVPDIGVRTPTGIITRTFYGGTEPRATTILNFKGDYPKHSLDVMSELTMLQQILETRLRERLREQMGATYNVSVRSAVQVDPTAIYEFTINFVSDPSRVDEMVAAVFDVVGKFKREGPTVSEVKNSVEMMLRDAETSQKTNDFWYGILEYDRRGWAYDQMVSNDRWTRMTPKIVKEAAVRYLNQNSYTQFTLKPVQSAPVAGRGSTSGPDGSK